MRNLLLSAALCAVTSVGLVSSASAQQTVSLPVRGAGRTRVSVRGANRGSQMAFALPSGERKEVPGITPHADRYCVCDPGPITPDCKAPGWIIGAWALGSMSIRGSILKMRSPIVFSLRANKIGRLTCNAQHKAGTEGLVAKSLRHSRRSELAVALRSLPKAEVHVHLEGCFEAATLAQWAAEARVPMPRPRDTLFQFGGLADFSALP